jgi:hypothetical protein
VSRPDRAVVAILRRSAKPATAWEGLITDLPGEKANLDMGWAV